MKWLISGGCGFIGTNLVSHLVQQRGHYLRIFDNLTVGNRKALGFVSEFDELAPQQVSAMTEDSHRVELVVGDILDAELTAQVVAGADTIVHLAANTGVGPSVEDPKADCLSNVIGTLNMLEAARHAAVGRFVFASSGAPLGEVEPPIHEKLAPRPASPYGASKLAGEGYCSAYYRTFGVVTVALRFGNVYGPMSLHKSSVIAKFIRNAQDGEILEVYGDGGQTRDFVYIDDLIAAITAAATVEDVGGEVFQIATNRETTVNELVTCLVPILKATGVGPITVGHGTPRLGDVGRNYADTSKAKTRLGWQAKVSLEEGLRRTVDWFVTHPATPKLKLD